MHFGSKNCETIKRLPCFTYTNWNKHKLLSRCVICICCEITVELHVAAFFATSSLLKSDRHKLSWGYHRAYILLDNPGNRKRHKLDLRRGENCRSTPRRNLLLKKSGRGISLPSRWEFLVPKQLGITFAALISRKMHLTQSGSKLRARKSN